MFDNVEELSSTCLKYGSERCSQKWYTSSVYPGTNDDPPSNLYVIWCEKEVFFLSKLEHANIVKFVGTYFKPNNPHPILVTEEVSSNLLHYLDKVQVLEDSEKYKFSCDISEGLAYLHNEGIAHLNLYSKSVKLTDNLTVKIADFEFATYLDVTMTSSSSSEPPGGYKFDLWQFRDDKSVFCFMPEDYRDRSYGLVDIYSFGCVVFHIFTLKQPTQRIKIETSNIQNSEVETLVIECLNCKRESMQEINSLLIV